LVSFIKIEVVIVSIISNEFKYIVKSRVRKKDKLNLNVEFATHIQGVVY
jgi:hypothetical protein